MVRELVKMNPADLPDLSKPFFRDQTVGKPKCPGQNVENKSETNSRVLAVEPIFSCTYLLGEGEFKNIGEWHPKYFLSGFWVIARTPPERF